ncbi:MAG: thioredoxin family protein [Proteobacteria bacterium]|nr:thioredoxin family protein [Pseudomonadota bacterium]
MQKDLTRLSLDLLAFMISATFLIFAEQALSQDSNNSKSTPNVISNLESSSDPSTLAKDIKPQDVIHWNPVGANFDQESGLIELTYRLSTSNDFTIYSDKLQISPQQGWFVESESFPKTRRQYDPISRKEVDVFSEGEFKTILSGPKGIMSGFYELPIKYVGCTQVICLFPHTEVLKFPISIQTVDSSQIMAQATNSNVNTDSTGADHPKSAESVDPSKSTPNNIVSPAETSAPAVGSFEEQVAKRVKDGTMSIWMLLMFAFAGGLLTNLTPCVAPMIPITIRLLSRQGPKPFLGSSMYALGIVATYTILGVFAAMSGALFGNLIAHPAVSITFGIIMALLGLSMLGFGNLSQLQQLGGKIGNGQSGPLNAFLMGTGAGLVASPCTGPILAALLTYTAGKSSVAEATALLGVYSIGFALPYVFLGASAAKISTIKVNFTIQIATKLIFASVMFGLSLYFLRIPLYTLFTQLQPYWAPIALISGIVGITSMSLFIVKSSLSQRKALMIFPSLVVGIAMFSGIQTLSRSSASAHDSLKWLTSESEAFEASKKEGKPILVDAWAEWCEACKKMDGTTFADPAIIKKLEESWILYKMDLTEPTDPNAALQEKYELPGLPTITLLPPGGDLASKVALNGYVSAEALLEELNKFGLPKK